MSALLIGIVVFTVGWMGTTYVTESTLDRPSYSVTLKKNGYEIRHYDSFLTVFTQSSGDFDTSLNQGFRQLAGYIFGNNESNETIKMTAPVFHQQTNDNHQVAFFISKQRSLNSLPKPSDSSIQFKSIELRQVAVISFRGYANKQRITRYQQTLLSKLQHDGFRYTNTPIYASYNSPYAFPLLKRHELLIPIRE